MKDTIMKEKLFALFLSFTGIGVMGQNHTFKPPIMGWSSWNTYRVNISDSLICRQANAMVSLGLKEKGYKFVNIDDGFFGYRDADGMMHPHPTRFPNGMKTVADHIHSLGLKAGIYSDAGSNTCGSIWDRDANGIGAGLYGHEIQDAKLYFKDWGFDFMKIDYCGAGQELNLEEERRYTEIRQAIDACGCSHVSLNICRWAFPGTWAASIAQSWRISGDIAPDWASVKHIIGKNLYLSAYARNGHYNDMDMLEVGRGLSENEEEVHFGMWCIMSSPLLIGCDLTDIPESSFRLLTNEELIALNQDPLGRQAYVVQHDGATYVLVKDILNLRSTTRAVAFYNPSDSVQEMEIALQDLELAGKTEVRDLLKHQNLPPVESGTLRILAMPRSVSIFRLKAEKRIEPVLYEAEWAYLPCFQDLGKTPKDIAYTPCAEASGKMKLEYLGGRSENIASWDEVYSENGGEYLMTVHYIPRPYSKLDIKVNDGPAVTLDKELQKEGTNPASTTVRVRLHPGNNLVIMGNAYGWAPDIDCFTLKPCTQ